MTCLTRYKQPISRRSPWRKSHPVAIKWLVKRPGTDGGKGIELDAGRCRCVRWYFCGKVSKDRLAQRYVSDLLLTPDGRKFDLRVYWVVASFRPELVLYGGGSTLRVSASNFTDKGRALT